MIRIAGLQKGYSAQDEFVLLQHQGTMRSQLRGHVLMAESVLTGAPGSQFVFTDEIWVNSGQFVLLRSGVGTNGWRPSKDGSMVYFVHANALRPLWSEAELVHLHLLHVQHSYVERKEESVYVGAV
jgi:hypothetical protein